MYIYNYIHEYTLKESKHGDDTMGHKKGKLLISMQVLCACLCTEISIINTQYMQYLTKETCALRMKRAIFHARYSKS